MQTFLSTASSSNNYTKTFDGIDISGRRLANEVRSLKFVLEKGFKHSPCWRLISPVPGS